MHARTPPSQALCWACVLGNRLHRRSLPLNPALGSSLLSMWTPAMFNSRSICWSIPRITSFMRVRSDAPGTGYLPCSCGEGATPPVHSGRMSYGCYSGRRLFPLHRITRERTIILRFARLTGDLTFEGWVHPIVVALRKVPVANSPDESQGPPRRVQWLSAKAFQSARRLRLPH